MEEIEAPGFDSVQVERLRGASGGGATEQVLVTLVLRQAAAREVTTGFPVTLEVEAWAEGEREVPNTKRDVIFELTPNGDCDCWSVEAML